MGFYFLTVIYKATNQPTPVHPNSQLYTRIHAAAVLFFLFWRPNHAGAKIIATTTATASAYLRYIKTEPNQSIFLIGGVYIAPLILI